MMVVVAKDFIASDKFIASTSATAFEKQVGVLGVMLDKLEEAGILDLKTMLSTVKQMFTKHAAEVVKSAEFVALCQALKDSITAIKYVQVRCALVNDENTVNDGEQDMKSTVFRLRNSRASPATSTREKAVERAAPPPSPVAPPPYCRLRGTNRNDRTCRNQQKRPGRWAKTTKSATVCVTRG